MSRLSRAARTPLVWLILAVSVPFAIGAVQLILDNSREPFYLYGDQALINIAVHRSLELLQFTGPYSRFGWDHPGPLYYFFIAPGTFLLGGGVGVYFGALLTNWLFSLLTTVLVARSCKPRTATVVVAMLLVFLFAQGPFALRDPWNPSIVVLPLLAAAFALSVRATAVSASLVALGCSIALQGHFGTVSVVASIVFTGVLVHLVATIVPSAEWLRGSSARRLLPRLKSLAIVGAVTLIAWALPLYDQISKGREGNFGRALYFNFTKEGERHTLDEAARAVIGASWLPSSPTLLPPTEFPGSIWFWFVGWLLVAGVGALVAWRRQLRVPFVLTTFSGLGLVIITVAVSRIVGNIEVYLLWWIPIPIVALLTGWLVLFFGEGGLIGKRGATAAAVIAFVGLLSATSANAALTLSQPSVQRFSRSEVKLGANAILDAAGTTPGSLALDIPDQAAMPVAAGIAATLLGDGRAVDVVPGLEKSFEVRDSKQPNASSFRLAIANSGNDVGGRRLAVTQTNPAISIRQLAP